MKTLSYEAREALLRQLRKVRSGREWGTVIDIRSRNVNGLLRAVAPTAFNFSGVDMEPGKGVDIVLDDPYTLRSNPKPLILSLAIRASSIRKYSGYFSLKCFEF
jgi:hypothetical protein